MVERKEFHSLEIDVENGVYKLNGEPMGKFVERVDLQYENGKWLLLITYTEIMKQVAAPELKV